MLKKKKTIKTSITLLLLLLLTINPTNKENITYAKGQELIIHLGEKNKQENTKLHIWKINKEDSLEELSKLSEEELRQKYGKEKLIEQNIDKEEITITELEEGYYYIKDSEKNKTQIVPTKIEITKAEKKEIYIKQTEEQPPKQHFKKISTENQKALKNAVFQVTKKERNKYIPIQKNNKNYIVESDKDGNFTVEDLEYGKYQLIEIKAPEGYEALKTAVEFEIKNNIGKTEDSILIKNKPVTPPLIRIPNTGDLIFFIMIIGGVILFTLGYRINKKA